MTCGIGLGDGRARVGGHEPAGGTGDPRHGCASAHLRDGFEHGAPEYFALLHPRGPWIEDPLGDTYYEAHHYWDEAPDPVDDPGSGRYRHEYATYLERAVAAGFTDLRARPPAVPAPAWAALGPSSSWALPPA